MTGPLARLAARALGAPAPMTGNPAAVIRPRLPARFETDAEPPRPAEEFTGAAEPVPQRPAADPSPQARTVRTTDRATTRELPAPSGILTPAAAEPTRHPPSLPGPPPSPLQPPPQNPPSTAAPVTGFARPVAEKRDLSLDRPEPARAATVAANAPQATPAPSPQTAASPPPAPLEPVHEPPPFRPAPVTSLSDRPPSDLPRPHADTPPDIIIHIGRIDVAAPAPPVPAARPAPTAPRHADLGDYLRGRAIRP
jgi:hypothetical protein